MHLGIRLSLVEKDGMPVVVPPRKYLWLRFPLSWRLSSNIIIVEIFIFIIGRQSYLEGNRGLSLLAFLNFLNMHKDLTRFQGLNLLWSSLLAEYMLGQGLRDGIRWIDVRHTVIKLLVQLLWVDELWRLAANLRQTRWTLTRRIPSLHVSHSPWHCMLLQLVVILLTSFFINQLYNTVVTSI